MSATAAQPVARVGSAGVGPTARVVVLVVLGATALLGIALLAASLVPSQTLATRLLGAAGETRSGAFAQ
jgi:hypothetical protein